MRIPSPLRAWPLAAALVTGALAAACASPTPPPPDQLWRQGSAQPVPSAASRIESTTRPLTPGQMQDLAGAPFTEGQANRLTHLTPPGGGAIDIPPQDGIAVGRNFNGLVQLYVLRPQSTELYHGVNLDPGGPGYIGNVRHLTENRFGGPNAPDASIAQTIARQMQYFTVDLVARDVQLLEDNRDLLRYAAQQQLIGPNGRLRLDLVPPAYQGQADTLQRTLDQRCLSLLPAPPSWVTVTPATGNLQRAVPNGSPYVLFGVTNLPALDGQTPMGLLFAQAAQPDPGNSAAASVALVSALNGTAAQPMPPAYSGGARYGSADYGSPASGNTDAGSAHGGGSNRTGQDSGGADYRIPSYRGVPLLPAPETR